MSINFRQPRIRVPLPEACTLVHSRTILMPVTMVESGSYFKFPFGSYTAANYANWGPINAVIGNGGKNQGNYIIGASNNGRDIVGIGNNGISILGDGDSGENICGDGSHGSDILGNGLTDMRYSAYKDEIDENAVFQYVPAVSGLFTFKIGYIDNNCPGDYFSVHFNSVPSINNSTTIMTSDAYITGMERCDLSTYRYGAETVISGSNPQFAQEFTRYSVDVKAAVPIFFIVKNIKSPYGGGTAFFYLQLLHIS